mgnify:CR=1 FL=1
MWYDVWAMYQTYSSKPHNQSLSAAENIPRFLKANALMMVHHIVAPVVYGPIILVSSNTPLLTVLLLS